MIFFFLHVWFLSLFIMQRVQSFQGFASEWIGREVLLSEDMVDTCLQAMQEGVLDVCAQNNNDHYVWLCFIMTADQWHRAGVASSILWQSTSRFIYREFMAEIEYFWTDLEAVQGYYLMQTDCYLTCHRLLKHELHRRQAWDACLTRVWSAACTI